jgi:hypothetical protein
MYLSEHLASSTDAERFLEPEMREQLAAFKERYIDENLLPKRLFLWNSLKQDVDSMLTEVPTAELGHVPIDGSRIVFAYLERTDEGFTLTFQALRKALEQREMGEEDDDVIVFDESRDWFVAVTHNDVTFVHGL